MNDETYNMPDLLHCAHCGRPIAPNTPLIHYGIFVTHQKNECRRILLAEIDSLRAQLAESHAEITEQARLLSMSAEREARLLAKLTECERELAHVKLMDAETLRACQRWIAEFNRLEAAIRKAPHGSICAVHWRPSKDIPFGPCDCWKRAALEGK